MNDLKSIFYETDVTGKDKLSFGRILIGISFLIACLYWMIWRTDAPSTLVATIGVFAGYVFAGKANTTVQQFLAAKTTQGE